MAKYLTEVRKEKKEWWEHAADNMPGLCVVIMTAAVGGVFALMHIIPKYS